MCVCVYIYIYLFVKYIKRDIHILIIDNNCSWILFKIFLSACVQIFL